MENRRLIKMPSPYVIPGVRFSRAMSIDYLFDLVMKSITIATGYSLETLCEYNRQRERVLARHATFYVLKKEIPSLTLVAIGKKFIDTNGKFRDHTTVMHGISTFKDLLDSDDTLAWELYNKIKTVI
jgi:chromosomal replication initiation ATPase DnaA